MTRSRWMSNEEHAALMDSDPERRCAHWPLDGKCLHCHDDPPPGHRCPRCGIVAADPFTQEAPHAPAPEGQQV